MHVCVQVLNTELFVWILILLHEYAILDLLVSACLLEIPWEHYCAHQQDEVLQRYEKEEEDDECGGVWTSE